MTNAEERARVMEGWEIDRTPIPADIAWAGLLEFLEVGYGFFSGSDPNVANPLRKLKEMIPWRYDAVVQQLSLDERPTAEELAEQMAFWSAGVQRMLKPWPQYFLSFIQIDMFSGPSSRATVADVRAEWEAKLDRLQAIVEQIPMLPLVNTTDG